MFATAEAIIDQAKHAFLSENFSVGFSVLRDCFDPEEITDKTILDMLCGKIGISVDGNDVEMSADIPVEEEYKEDIDSVLMPYRTLYQHGNNLLTVDNFYEINIGAYFPAEGNDSLKALINSKGKVVPVSEVALAAIDLNPIGSHMYVTNEGIYFLKENTKTLWDGISEKQNTIEDAIAVYKNITNL